MITKQQHYYPRCLLKHFANEDGKVHVYITKTNKLKNIDYRKICSSNYTYESADIVDNILENKLGKYETKLGNIINNILSNITSEGFSVTEEDQQFLYQYLWLQYIRTDAGRINFMSIYNNTSAYTPRSKPIEVSEIQENKEKIEKFNLLFKQEGMLERFLNYFTKPNSMNFHLAISKENLLTSDNPVIGTDEWKRLILPINPYICIEFTDISIDKASTMLVLLNPENTKYLNEATINTANYFVISNQSFTFAENNYLYNRFRNESWEFGKPHFYN